MCVDKQVAYTRVMSLDHPLMTGGGRESNPDFEHFACQQL